MTTSVSPAQRYEYNVCWLIIIHHASIAQRYEVHCLLLDYKTSPPPVYHQPMSECLGNHMVY